MRNIHLLSRVRYLEKTNQRDAPCCRANETKVFENGKPNGTREDKRKNRHE